MKRFAFFLGCNIPIRIPQYATALSAVCSRFAIELVDIPEFNCCGYPARNVDEKAYLLPSVRNLAIAEKHGLDILAICNCCFASLRKALRVMNDNPGLLAGFNALLAKEDLHYSGKVEVHHYLAVLHQEVGIDAIRTQLTKVYSQLRIALLYGCHILRPRQITGFDDSFVPRSGEDLLQVCGATSLDWRGKMECCGAALAGINDTLAHRLLDEKISTAQAAGADFITPVCAYCHLQLDTVQQHLIADNPSRELLPVLLYPQLLGLCLGIDPQLLGISQNGTITAAVYQDLLGRLQVPVEKPKRKPKKSVAAAG